MKYLIIVESPNKIKTLENIIKDINSNDKFKVIATAGHILDLDKKNMGVDLKTFQPKYVEIESKKAIIANIKKQYKQFNPDQVLLAGDIDFEGTFINWSVKEILGLDNPRTLEFIALTKEDVIKGLSNQTFINYHHLEAQQTRRILDRVCGFSITDKLFKLYGGNVSAGRVQSVVSKLIIEKEREIKEWFKGDKERYYDVKCFSDIGNGNYPKIKEIDFDKFQIKPYLIKSINTKTLNIKPNKPFNTSSLQQKASLLFHYSPSNTMSILQSLFTKGFITYHRTTSIVLSEECLNLCKEYIINKYGESYYQRRVYYDKKNNSENSHEAIRPTINYVPKELNEGEKKLFKLIFDVTIQSQMKDKIVNETNINVNNGVNQFDFVICNKEVEFKGFDIVKGCNENISDKDNITDKDNISDNENQIIKNLKINDQINITKITFQEKFINPPNRYSEASLINKLSPKNLNIGRPSTYASIIDKIIKRGYVRIGDIEGEKVKTIDYVINFSDNNCIDNINANINDDNNANETKENIKNQQSSQGNNIEQIDNFYVIGEEKNKFIPNELGFRIVDFMNDNFDNIMDYHFTAELEDKLDLIGDNKLTKLSTLREFYDQLKVGLNKTDLIIKENKKGNIVGNREGKEIILKTGRYGEYVSWNGHNFNCKNCDDNISDLNVRYNKLIDYYINKEEQKGFEYEGVKIVIKNGRYGNYFTFKDKNYSIKEELDKITDQMIKDIIEEDKNKVVKKIGRYQIINGPYGLYFRYGKKNIGIPKSYDIETLNNDDIKELIEKNKKKFKKSKK